MHPLARDLTRDQQRGVAVQLLRTGAFGLGEIGQHLGLSRQTIHYWAEKHARFDYRRRRADFIKAAMRKAIQQGGDHGLSKDA